MSPANVYRFFESKAAIFEAIAAHLLARSEALAQRIVAEQRPASERLRRLIIEMHRYTREQYLQESRVHEIVTKAMDEQWGVIDAHIQRIRGFYLALVEEGVRAGEFARQHARTRASCVFNAVIPFCHPQIVAEQFAHDRGRQAQEMADFLLHALRAEQP